MVRNKIVEEVDEEIFLETKRDRLVYIQALRDIREKIEIEEEAKAIANMRPNMDSSDVMLIK